MFLKIFIASLIGWLIFSYYSDSNIANVIGWIKNIMGGILHHEVVSENRLNNIDMYDEGVPEYNFADSQNESTEYIMEKELPQMIKTVDTVDTDHDELLKFALETDIDDNNPFICSDNDGDSCDDCSSGYYNLNNDGDDSDGDGLCDAGDPDSNCADGEIDECGICNGDGTVEGFNCDGVPLDFTYNQST